MKELLLFLIPFIVIYLCYFFFVILSKKKMEKFKNNAYYNFLVKTYKLDDKKIPLKLFAHIISLSNSFIISTTFVIICLVESFVLKMLLAFAVILPLQLIVYFIIGKLLQKKYGK